MDWNAISAVSETLAALGVIVSLVYLGIQVRMSRTESVHNSIDRLVELWSTFSGALADHPQLSAAFSKGLEDLGGLDETEKVMVFAHFGRVLRISEAIFLHHVHGTVSASLWNGVDSSITDMLRVPAVRQYWQIRRHWFCEEFQAYAAARIQDFDPIDFYPEPFSADAQNEGVGSTLDQG